VGLGHAPVGAPSRGPCASPSGVQVEEEAVGTVGLMINGVE
jgi:hypothetical protein